MNSNSCIPTNGLKRFPTATPNAYPAAKIHFFAIAGRITPATRNCRAKNDTGAKT